VFPSTSSEPWQLDQPLRLQPHPRGQQQQPDDEIEVLTWGSLQVLPSRATTGSFSSYQHQLRLPPMESEDLEQRTPRRREPEVQRTPDEPRFPEQLRWPELMCVEEQAQSTEPQPQERPHERPQEQPNEEPEERPQERLCERPHERPQEPPQPQPPQSPQSPQQQWLTFEQPRQKPEPPRLPVPARSVRGDQRTALVAAAASFRKRAAARWRGEERVRPAEGAALVAMDAADPAVYSARTRDEEETQPQPPGVAAAPASSRRKSTASRWMTWCTSSWMSPKGPSNPPESNVAWSYEVEEPPGPAACSRSCASTASSSTTAATSLDFNSTKLAFKLTVVMSDAGNRPPTAMNSEMNGVVPCS